MKRKIFILLAFLGSVVGMSSCHKDNTVTYSYTSQDMVARSASYFNFQVQAGQYAQSHGVNDSVKAYGKVMVTDNTTALAALKTLASTKSLTVTSTLAAADQSALNSLMAQSGTAFDQAYAQSMVLSHNKETAFFTQTSQSNVIADADLRTFAFNQLPLLSVRLQQAYHLQSLVTTNP